MLTSAMETDEDSRRSTVERLCARDMRLPYPGRVLKDDVRWLQIQWSAVGAGLEAAARDVTEQLGILAVVCQCRSMK
jgi:hypothetical protein